MAKNGQVFKNIRKILFIYALIIVSIIRLQGQIPNNSWRDHLAYNAGKTIAITPNKVYCSMTTGGMLSFDKSSGEIEKYSKVTGLSDINISAIAYSEMANILVIGYQNGNIDLITGDDNINMPDIERKRITGSKSINQITIHNYSAYLSCHFGIVEIDLNKLEIKDSYFFGPNGSNIKVNDVAILEGFIYAATESGIYKADLNSSNLVDYSNWANMTNIPQSTSEYKLVEAVDKDLLAVYNSNSSGDQIIRISDGDSWNNWNPVSDTVIYQLLYYNDNLSVVTDEVTYFYNKNYQLTNSLNILNGRYSLVDADGSIYSAANYRGFLLFRNNAEEQVLGVNSPRFNTTSNVFAKTDNVWVCSGGPANPYYQGAIHNFSNEKWTSFSNGYTQGIGNIGNFYKVAFHPDKENCIYAGTYKYGIYKIDDYQVTTRYDSETVPLFAENLSGILGVRVMGLGFDNKGDLWTVMDETPQCVFVLRQEKEWERLELKSPTFLKNSKWRGLMVTKETNQVWLLSLEGYIVVLKEESDGTILERQFTIKNQEGEVLSNAYCITEDKEGKIWIGTNKGPIVYQKPGNEIFDGAEISGSQIKLPRNDGTDQADFLLDYEIINDIAIDGGNRKWLATASSGVFLVSSEGKETLQQFNFDNSPLFSNSVISIGIHEKSGEVFISTNKGLLAFMGRATEGNDDFKDVYVYPNPIKPNYTGDITITGLIENASVKITDISGNLVYETISLGGQAVWDGKNFDGKRVQTGVYLVFLTNSDGSKTHITKFVFIH